MEGIIDLFNNLAVGNAPPHNVSYDDIVDKGMHATKNQSQLAYGAVYDIIETTYKYALYCGRENDADVVKAMEMLTNKFGKTDQVSTRVKILQAMKQEADGNLSSAKEIYKTIIAEEESNTSARKRLVCIAKSTGDISIAVKYLLELVSLNSSDKNAMQQLIELYIETGKFDFAKHVMEDLILICPENHAYHTQYADMLYTLGGKNNFRLARQYYCQSLELKPKNNMRAMIGLCLSTRAGGVTQESESVLYEKIRNAMTKAYQTNAKEGLLKYVDEAMALPEIEEGKKK